MWHSPTAYGAVSFGLILAGAWMQWLGFLNPDSAWLLMLAERMAGGEALYLEVSETNPPLIVWLNYLPVWRAQFSSLNLHQALIICASLVLAVSAFGCWRVNRAYPVLNWFYLVAMVVLAPSVFAQREWLMLALAMPYLLGWLAPNRPSVYWALPAAIGLMLKPHFILLVAALALVRAVQERSLRTWMQPAQWVIVGAHLAYLFYLLVIDTVYVTAILPMLLESYAAFERPLPGVWLIAGVLLALLPLMLREISGATQAVTVSLYAALCAGLLIGLLQQKGWLNHFFPFVVMLWLLAGWMVARAASSRVLRLLALLVVLALGARGLVEGYRVIQRDYPPATAQKLAVLAEAKGDTLFALSFDLTAAYPVALHAQMRDVSPYAHLWFLPEMVRDGGSHPPTETPEARYYEQVVASFVAARPDWVLVSAPRHYDLGAYGQFAFDFLAYYRAHPAFDAAWQHYRLIDTVGGVRMYQRVNSHDN